MAIFGLLSTDIILDQWGTARAGTIALLYTSQALANAGGTPLTFVRTSPGGRFEYSNDALATVWARTLNGTVLEFRVPGAAADDAVESSTYGRLKNDAGAPVLGQTAMFGRTNIDGSLAAGDSTPKGCLEVYTQIGAMAHDLALVAHGHADIHIARAAPSNRAQLVTITGAPTGGTFTLTYGGQTTTPLAYNVAGADVQTALLALSTLAGSTVFVYSETGGAPAAGGPWTISLTIADPTALTATASLTGGSSPSVTVSQTVPDGQLYLDMPLGSFKVSGYVEGNYGGTGTLVSKVMNTTAGSFLWRNAADGEVMRLSGLGALTLGSLVVSGNADVPSFIGGGTVGGMIFNGGTTGVKNFRFRDSGDADRFYISVDTPPSGNTNMGISYHNGTAVNFQWATVGAADSGGAGFRVLRVPN